MRPELVTIWPKHRGCNLRIDASISRYDMGICTNNEMASEIHTKAKEKADEVIINYAREGDRFADIHKGYTVAKLAEMKNRLDYEAAYNLTLKHIRVPDIKVTPGELQYEFKPKGKIVDFKI